MLQLQYIYFGTQANIFEIFYKEHVLKTKFLTHTGYKRNLREAIFLVPVSPPVRFEGRKLRFFERAIFDNFWSSNAPRCASLRFHVFCFLLFFGVGEGGARPPANFGDLELTGTKKGFPE